MSVSFTLLLIKIISKLNIAYIYRNSPKLQIIHKYPKNMWNNSLPYTLIKTLAHPNKWYVEVMAILNKYLFLVKAAIFDGERGCQKQFRKRTTYWSFESRLVKIGIYLGVSEDVDISNVGIERMKKQHWSIEQKS